MKIKDWLLQARQELEKTGIDSARLDSIVLLEKTLLRPKEWIIAHDDTTLESDMVIELNKKLARRKEREPLAYILGTKEFYGRTFTINSDVLIPRPESEVMIELLLDTAPQLRPTTIVDIGTGSGILAITAKLEIPGSTVIATDISPQALRVACKNAALLGADVQFYQSDLLPASYDPSPAIILANLPYVPDQLITSPEITKEPALALFSGADGLDCYLQFWEQLTAMDGQISCVITESLESQHQEMKHYASQAGYELARTQGLIQQFFLAA